MNETESPKQEVPDQLSDILLVLNKETKRIEAVKGIDKDGKLETVPPLKKNANQFMKVDKHGDVFSNFFSNFFSQLKNPTNFSFFKVDGKSATKTAADIQKAIDSPSDKGKDLLEKFEVAVGDKNNESQNQNSMDNTQNANPPENEYRYKVEEIDWKTMDNLGLNKEKLEKKNLLDGLLRGYKTNDLVPISVNLGSAVTRLDARLQLQRKADQTVMIAIHGIRKEPNLAYPFYGHEFTKEDKDNLLKTGNMGRIVELNFSTEHNKVPSILSIDRKTNEIISFRADKIKIPNEIKGVKLDKDQKKTLMEGKPLYLVDMVSNRGEQFSSNVQFNADKCYVEILTDRSKSNIVTLNNVQDTPQEAPKLVRGKELDGEQYQKFNAGERLYVSDFVNAKGENYNGFITFDKKTGETDFSFPNAEKLSDKVQSDESTKGQDKVDSNTKKNGTAENSNEPLKSGQTNADSEKQQQERTSKRQGVRR